MNKLICRLKKGCKEFLKDSYCLIPQMSSSRVTVSMDDDCEDDESTYCHKPCTSYDRMYEKCLKKAGISESCLNYIKRKHRQKLRNRRRESRRRCSSSSTVYDKRRRRCLNWLKVGLALRSACDFMSPALDELVCDMEKCGEKNLRGCSEFLENVKAIKSKSSICICNDKIKDKCREIDPCCRQVVPPPPPTYPYENNYPPYQNREYLYGDHERHVDRSYIPYTDYRCYPTQTQPENNHGQYLCQPVQPPYAYPRRPTLSDLDLSRFRTKAFRDRERRLSALTNLRKSYTNFDKKRGRRKEKNNNRKAREDNKKKTKAKKPRDSSSESESGSEKRKSSGNRSPSDNQSESRSHGRRSSHNVCKCFCNRKKRSKVKSHGVSSRSRSNGQKRKKHDDRSVKTDAKSTMNRKKGKSYSNR